MSTPEYSRTIFYSWQSDLPGNVTRSLFREALDAAVELLVLKGDGIEEAPRVESDTSGLPGAPLISPAILGRIDRAAVFVCDLSIINDYAKRRVIRELIERELARLEREGEPATGELSQLKRASTERPTPNPNVLYEFGYAMRSLGAERVLIVMNEAFGGKEELRFDLRLSRVHSIDIQERSGQRSQVLRGLIGHFKLSLEAIFDSVGPRALVPETDVQREELLNRIETLSERERQLLQQCLILGEQTVFRRLNDAAAQALVGKGLLQVGLKPRSVGNMMDCPFMVRDFVWQRLHSDAVQRWGDAWETHPEVRRAKQALTTSSRPRRRY